MINLDETTALYELAAGWTGDRVLIEHPAIEQFSAGVSALLAGLGDEQHEDFWAGLSRPLKRLRWLLATTPLPVNHPANAVQATADAVVPRLRQCRHSAPALAERAEALADLLEHFWACGDDPLGDAVRAHAAGAYVPVVIVLADGHAAPVVGDAFGPSFRPLTVSQLLRTRTEHAIAVGPSAWFDAELLRAPRAALLTFAYFGWLRDKEPELELLVGAQESQPSPLGKPPARSSSRVILHAPATEDARDWVPKIEWNAVNRAARRHARDGHGEPVPAQLFVLVSGDGVYLDAKDGAQVHIAELEAEVTVRQVPVRSLRDGTFLIARTAGEGDYIRELADRLLGAQAAHLRQVQSRWKQKLGSEIAGAGIRAVSRRLTRLGATRASEENVRRWASPDSIRTQDPADFNAICRLAGEPFEAMWASMGLIAAAHMRAGNEVRQLLVDEIRKADSADLLQRGWSDYDAESIEGHGTLRVARIAGRSPAIEDVPRNRLRKPFKVNGDLWLA